MQVSNNTKENTFTRLVYDTIINFDEYYLFFCLTLFDFA
jgi:hypothetical protein